MKSSLPTVSEEDSKVAQTGSFQDVEKALHKPLLGELKASKHAQSAIVRSTKKPGYARKLWRGQSSPSFGLSSVENLKPPYRNDDDVSVLCKACVAVVVYLAVGIFSFYFTNDDLFGIKTETFVDALYFCVVTLTTVGYGDLVPGTTIGKLFTSAYIFVGFGLVGALVSGAANYIVERQEKILAHAIKRKERHGYEQAEETDVRTATSKVVVSGILVVSLVVMGTVFLISKEGMTFIDAVYCVCVTVTTLGYGDHSFHTITGRLFAAIWILTGTVCVAQFFLYIAEMRTENRQLKLAKWVLHRRTTRSDMEAADMDHDGVVSAPEFVIFKLKELGKIDEEDVVGILKEFERLDCDRSGTISMGDLRFAEPT